jgi:hypothetical protein
MKHRIPASIILFGVLLSSSAVEAGFVPSSTDACVSPDRLDASGAAGNEQAPAPGQRHDQELRNIRDAIAGSTAGVSAEPTSGSSSAPATAIVETPISLAQLSLSRLCGPEESFTPRFFVTRIFRPPRA